MAVLLLCLSPSQVQEWLCLNCQMQRALGMDMTTPRSKSQQQIHSPSHAAKPEPTPDAAPQPQAQPSPQTQPQAQTKQTGPAGPGRQQVKLPPGAVPLPGMAKAPSQPDLSRSSPAHQAQQPRQDQTRSAGSSPSRQPPPPEQTFGKLFGFGASLLNQASTLISESTQPQQQPPKPAPKPGGPQGPGPGAGKPSGPQPAQQGPRAPPQQQQQQTQPDASSKPKSCCPLCKTALNVDNAAEQPNYNTCTQCHSQVCNMCGFNPTPHLVEVRIRDDLFAFQLCKKVSECHVCKRSRTTESLNEIIYWRVCVRNAVSQCTRVGCVACLAVWFWIEKLHFTEDLCWHESSIWPQELSRGSRLPPFGSVSPLSFWMVVHQSVLFSSAKGLSSYQGASTGQTMS